MKKVVKKYEGGGIYANNSKIVPKSKTVKPATKPVVKPPIKKNAAAGKATAYKTTAAPYISSSSPAYKKLTPEQRNKNTQAQLKHDMAGSSSDFSGKTKVAYNKNNNTKTVVNYKADGTKQVKVINYSKTAAAKKAPVKAPVGTPGKTAYDVLKNKQAVVKNPRIGTPVKGTNAGTSNPKKTVTVKKSTVKTNPTKTVEEQITPLATKKPSEVAPSVSSINMSPVTNTKSTPDRVKAPVKKSTPSMGERLTGYKGTSRPVASVPVSTTVTPTETTSGRVSLMDRIKGNIAKRKMKKMAKLSEQVGQSRAMGSYAQPAMKKGGTKKYAKGGFPDLNKDGEVTKADILKGRGVIKKKGGATMDKYQKGGTKKPMMSPAKIKVTPGNKKPSYNEVFKTKKK